MEPEWRIDDGAQPTSRGSMTNLWAVLNYEIQMYFGIEMLQHFQLTASHPAIMTLLTSGLTEVKVLHTRILTQLFLPGGKPDDIKIDDLLTAWRGGHADLVRELEDAYTKPLEIGEAPKWYLDKYLAHATKNRGDSFDWTPITHRMDPPLRAILKSLPTDDLPNLAAFADRL